MKESVRGRHAMSPAAHPALGELWHVFIRNFTKSPDPTVTGKFCRRAAGIAAQNRGQPQKRASLHRPEERARERHGCTQFLETWAAGEVGGDHAGTGEGKQSRVEELLSGLRDYFDPLGAAEELLGEEI